MCWQNYTQHSGCGHYGEVYTNLYTPCETAFHSLLSKRGPSSPPLQPPSEFIMPPPPKRTSTIKSNRFFSMGNVLSRSNTTSTQSSRRAASGPEPSISRSSTSSFIQEGGNDLGVPDHELAAMASSCPDLKTRTIVSNVAGQVCKECLKWIEPIRVMLKKFDERKGIRGTKAFEAFLKESESARETAHMLGFWPPPAPNLGVGRREEDELYGMRPLD